MSTTVLKTRTGTFRYHDVTYLELNTDTEEKNKKAILDFISTHQLDKEWLVQRMLIEVAHMSHEYPGALDTLAKNIELFPQPQPFPADLQYIQNKLHEFTVQSKVKWIYIKGNSYYHAEDVPRFYFADEKDQSLPTPLACSICLESVQLGDKLTRFPCQGIHYFHTGCLSKWLSTNNRCPLCITHIYCTDKDTNRLLEAIRIVKMYSIQQQLNKEMITLYCKYH